MSDIQEHALRDLVREAAWEARTSPRNLWKNPHAPEFNPAGVQVASREILADVLLSTDALQVLDRLLNGEPTE